MYPKQQTFFILGLSRSGRAAAQYLLGEGATVYIYDDMDAGVVSQNKKTLCELGAKLISKEDLPSMPDRCDALIISPGIAIDHPVSVAFRRKKKAVLGESELAVRRLPANFIGVTGTNGKTTTVSMITQILESAGERAYACGNIGMPMIGLVKQPAPYFAVAEISSFQLETLNSFCPHIAVVLNVSQDHLTRHYNMENYIFLKAKILKNLTESEVAVLNYDDAVVREFAENTKAKIVYFSMRTKNSGGYFDGKDLYYGDEKIVSADKLMVEGVHNVQNALASICVAKLLGIDNGVIASALENFQGVRHRLENVGEVAGVEFIDDSKATNVDAALKAVGCMKKETILLLGGKDKQQTYDGLFATIKGSQVVHTVLYGENRFRLIEAAEKTGWDKVTLCTGFDCAVRLAHLFAKEGQAVLLSPASASFDEFADYEERGERFVAIVKKFQEKSKEISLVGAAVETSKDVDEGFAQQIAFECLEE